MPKSKMAKFNVISSGGFNFVLRLIVMYKTYPFPVADRIPGRERKRMMNGDGSALRVELIERMILCVIHEAIPISCPILAFLCGAFVAFSIWHILKNSSQVNCRLRNATMAVCQ